MSEQQVFAQPGASEWTELAPGNRRRVLIHTPELMQVEFGFDKGAVGALHSHPHIQVSYVAEGSFEVTIAGKTEIVGQGRLVDVFTPMRQDFI